MRLKIRLDTDSDAVKLVGIASQLNENITLTDNIKFSKEYTSVNADNVFVYRNINEIINILDNGTGIVYLGFPECKWCQAYVPYLNEVAKENNLEKRRPRHEVLRSGCRWRRQGYCWLWPG